MVEYIYTCISRTHQSEIPDVKMICIGNGTCAFSQSLRTRLSSISGTLKAFRCTQPAVLMKYSNVGGLIGKDPRYSCIAGNCSKEFRIVIDRYHQLTLSSTIG